MFGELAKIILPWLKVRKLSWRVTQGSPDQMRTEASQRLASDRQKRWTDTSQRPGAAAGVAVNQCLRCKGYNHWAAACTATDMELAQRSRQPTAPNRGKPIKQSLTQTVWRHKPMYICKEWNRDPTSCVGGCGLQHICNNYRCRRTTDRHAAAHFKHRTD